MDAFPAFLPLDGARVVVAGRGPAAEAKARLFDGSPARLDRLDAPEAATEAACAGAILVFIAGDDPVACAAAATRARAAGALVNVVDRPELGDFATPSIVDRGAVVGAVGTGGAAPVLAVRLRQELEARWPAGLGGLARLMGALRPAIRDAAPDWARRRRLLGALMRGPWADAALAGDAAAAERLARAALREGRLDAPAEGGVDTVSLPADANDLTLREARLIGRADRLVGEAPVEVLALARRDAPRHASAAADERAAWAAAGERIVAFETRAASDA